MKTLKVPDMHCEMCVSRITRALTAEGIGFQVNLAEQTVSVEEGKVPAAMEALEDLGFSAQKAD